MGIEKTIAPNSDQTNSDDLIAGPRTIVVTSVKVTDDPKQPVSISYEGDSGKPYKPCKSMRRVLFMLWGANEAEYVGRSMTIYRDSEVKYGGESVGGIRISHMSDIESDRSLSLTFSRAVKRQYRVSLLKTEARVEDLSELIAEVDALLPQLPEDARQKAEAHIAKCKTRAAYQSAIKRIHATIADSQKAVTE